MKRTLVLITSIVMLMTLVGICAWVTFAPIFQKKLGILVVQSGLIFCAAIASDSGTSIVAELFSERLGLRLLEAMDGLLYEYGPCAAAYSAGDRGLLRFGIVVLSGIGIVCSCVGARSVFRRYYPHHGFSGVSAPFADWRLDNMTPSGVRSLLASFANVSDGLFLTARSRPGWEMPGDLRCIA